MKTSNFKFFSFPFTIFKVSGHSMEPTLKAGQFVLVNRWSHPKVGDIVVAHDIQRDIEVIKRVKKIGGLNIVLTGDNPGHGRDRIVDKSQIVGKAIL